jgi:hypothetical protein
VKGILKWPLIVAAVVVVMRVIVERAGAPAQISNLFSVAALTTVLGPLYFAIQVALGKKPGPYLMQLQLVFVYALCVRAMVLPTYWAARIFNWTEPRFSGVNTPNPILGFLGLPLLTAAFWVVVSLVSGTILGFATLAITRSRNT